MKKILIFIMLLTMIFSLVGCGNSKSDDTVSKVKVENNDAEEFEEENEPLELKENAEYVLVALKSKYIVVESEEDFSSLKVAYIDETDGEAYAKYYDFAEIGMYNAVNDLHSGITGMDFDVGIIDKEKFSTYNDWEIVWEMKQ